MKMINITSQKGITIVALIATIIVILILSTVVVTSTYTGSDYKRYKMMCADIQLLEDKVILYYNKYGELPIENKVEVDNLFENVGTHEFYKIDVSKLSNITLNYGNEDDAYIIDSVTFEVYYPQGIEYDGQTYYTD